MVFIALGLSIASSKKVIFYLTFCMSTSYRTKKNWLHFGTHPHLVWIQELWKILQHWEIPRAFSTVWLLSLEKLIQSSWKPYLVYSGFFCICSFVFTLKFVICIQSCACIYSVFMCVLQVNGTACAIPRLIIAILENYQQSVCILQLFYLWFSVI